MRTAQSVILVCFLLVSSAAFGQEIIAYRTFGGMRFEMDTLTLTHRQVSELLSINPVAAKEFSQARNANAISGIMGFAGAVLLAIPITRAITGGDPQWVAAAAGAALIVASIPISRSYKRKATSAVEAYNAGLEKKAHLYFKGAAMCIKF